MTNIPEETTVVEAQPEVVVVEQPAPAKKMNIFALVGFIVSLITLLLNSFLGIAGIIIGVLSFVSSIVGVIQCNKNRAASKGRGLGIAGIVLGAFSVLSALLILLGVLASI